MDCYLEALKKSSIAWTSPGIVEIRASMSTLIPRLRRDSEVIGPMEAFLVFLRLARTFPPKGSLVKFIAVDELVKVITSGGGTSNASRSSGWYSGMEV